MPKIPKLQREPQKEANRKTKTVANKPKEEKQRTWEKEKKNLHIYIGSKLQKLITATTITKRKPEKELGIATLPTAQTMLLQPTAAAHRGRERCTAESKEKKHQSTAKRQNAECT